MQDYGIAEQGMLASKGDWHQFFKREWSDLRSTTDLLLTLSKMQLIVSLENALIDNHPSNDREDKGYVEY